MAVRDSLAKLQQLATQRLGRTVTRSTLGSREQASRTPAAAIELKLPARFRVRHKLGQGGMGVVYRVYDAESGHDVALKSLQTLDPADLYYLKQEFRGLAGIIHPNLIQLYELHAAGSSCYFTMELVTGTNLLSYLRVADASGETQCDFERLRDAARQLALALIAVHAAGKLHRDIKPSNIMVSTAGRVVLLDFGLVAPIPRGQTHTLPSAARVGTLGYMPPEQLRSEPLTVAADWYSFGATLYEAAVGHRPVKEVWRWAYESRFEPPPRISSSVSSVPPDLDDLIAALLSRDPSARPGAAAVLEVLTAPGAGERRAGSVLPPIAEAPDEFQNRNQELARLCEGLERVRAGHATTIHLHGPSGIGKSELVRQFTAQARSSGAIVLEGCCHPQESLVFNALDGMVDSLSQELEQLPADVLTALLPPNADALPKLFPVLARIDALARLADDARSERGLSTVQRGTSALKALLAALAARVPLVISLDDVQWGDDDSGKMLRELVQAPGAPNMLLLLSYRSEERAVSRMLSVLDAATAPAAQADAIALGPLSDSDILALIKSTAGSTEAADRELAAVVREAAGYPFLAQQIGRYLAEVAEQPDALLEQDLALSEILARRMDALPLAARQLVEIVAVAGGPLEQTLLLGAAGLDDTARPVLRHLEQLHLVRSTTLGPEARTEIYHHRIRDGVIERLAEDARRARHRTIAQAMLTAVTPNLPQIVEHFSAASDVAAVSRYAAAAAKQAADVFAFERAAGLYRLAIDAGSREPSLCELYERLGDALANAGHGRDAGSAFERAAELGRASAAPDDYLLSLRKRAAEQYLTSWHRLEAARALEAVLEPLGIELPKSRMAALRELLANRIAIAFRRRRLQGTLRVVDPVLSDRLDVLMTLMKVYTMIDHSYGFAFGSRLLLEALQQRDAHFIQLGLACETASWASMGGALARRQADSHLEQLVQLGRSHGDAYIQVAIRACTGEKHHFRGEFREAVVHLEASLIGFRSLPRGLTLDLAVQMTFYLAALGFLGRLREQSAILETELASAEARGDNYFLATNAAGHSSLAWIVCGRGADAARWAERVLALAPPGVSSQYYFHLVTTVTLQLHAGDGISAFRRIDAAWPALSANHYLRLSLIGDDLRYLRARAALAAAGTLRNRARRRALEIALQEASAIEQHDLPFAGAWAELIRAGAAQLRGDHAQATQHLRAAMPGLERCGLSLMAAVTGYALQQRGCAQPLAERWLREAGVSDLRAATRLFLPGVTT